MGEHVSDEQHLAIEMDRGDHSILVAADIEDVEIADAVGGVQHGFELSEVCKNAGFDDLAPSLKRLGGCTMHFGEVDERLVRDHSHQADSRTEPEIMVSRFEIIGNKLRCQPSFAELAGKP